MKHFLALVSLAVVLLVASSCTSEETPPSAPAATAEATSLPVSTSTAPTEKARTSLEVKPTEDPVYAGRRETLVEEGVIGWGISDEAVIEVMRMVPRHEFVPPDYLPQAYENHPLPIGYGQTISQPYIVALMTQAAGVDAGDRVLEIGTGSGYQAAVLAELVDHVYTMEIIGPLAESAEATLERLGYDNVTVRHADGYYGWEDEAPFDAIVATAAPDHIPQPLVQQLKIGGRLIIPVGPVGGYQTLWLLTKVSEDEVMTKDLGGVSFVPLTRQEQ